MTLTLRFKQVLCSNIAKTRLARTLFSQTLPRLLLQAKFALYYWMPAHSHVHTRHTNLLVGNGFLSCKVAIS